jgi:hypothetical protein
MEVDATYLQIYKYFSNTNLTISGNSVQRVHTIESRWMQWNQHVWPVAQTCCAVQELVILNIFVTEDAQTYTISLNCINPLIFVVQTQRVSCELETEFLNPIFMNYKLRSAQRWREDGGETRLNVCGTRGCNDGADSATVKWSRARIYAHGKTRCVDSCFVLNACSKVPWKLRQHVPPKHEYPWSKVHFTYPHQNIINTHKIDTIHINKTLIARLWPTT